MTYCVYLTVYQGSKLPPFYIGYTTVANIRRGYNGSVSSNRYSKSFHTERKVNSQLFSTHILETFETEADAKQAETELQLYYKADKDDRFMNDVIHDRKRFEKVPCKLDLSNAVDMSVVLIRERLATTH